MRNLLKALPIFYILMLINSILLMFRFLLKIETTTNEAVAMILCAILLGVNAIVNKLDKK